MRASFIFLDASLRTINLASKLHQVQLFEHASVCPYWANVLADTPAPVHSTQVVALTFGWVR